MIIKVGQNQEIENLVWIDFEMTGLDPEQHTVIQAAVIVTDINLNVLAESEEIVIHASEKDLDRASDWVRDTFGESGLLQQVRESKVTMQDAEKSLLEVIRKYVGPKLSPLCGNSVHVDRKFMEKYLPNLNAHLHFRNIDVSSLKQLVRMWYPDLSFFEKKETHTALEDIRESIAELRFYKDILTGGGEIGREARLNLK